MHEVWILEYGDNGSEWRPDAKKEYDLREATFRNTFTVFPNSWTAVRVKFDNAGVALFRKCVHDGGV